MKAYTRPTAQHGSAVRSEQDFFGQMCGALDGIAEVLVAGPQMSHAAFRHCLEKHRPALAPRIVGYGTVDHPTSAQLVALARPYFLKFDHMAGTPTPS